MRLDVILHGQRLGDRIKLALIGLMSRRRAPDVIRTIFYRKEFFGKPLNVVFQSAMRGPSAWSVGQRELFAAFVSKKNECEF
jgi:hypothetical protein